MKIFKVIIIIAMIAAIAILGVSLYHTTEELKAAKADIAGMSFTEGEVIENKNGGVVTVSIKDSVYFKTDSFVSDSKQQGSSLSEIFCELHTNGYVHGFNNSLAKIVYTKKIIVQDGTTSERTYYLVGDYYISIQK